MTRTPFGLDQLVQHVESAASDSSPLERLNVAVAIGAEVSTLADEVVDYHVDMARREGCSWNDIGAALGVSRQAAQQRFASLNVDGGECQKVSLRLTPAARRVLRQARKEANRRSAHGVDTEDLLVAILRERNVLAMKIVIALGLDISAVEARLRERTRKRTRTVQPTGTGTFTREAAAALERATANAAALKHGYVGTEHLLLGLLAAPGTAREVLEDLGVDYIAVRRQTEEFLRGPDVSVRLGSINARVRR